MSVARARLAALVEARIGLRLAPARRADPVIKFLERAAHRMHLPDPEAYVDHLASLPESAEEFVALVSVVTNGQTHFFRHHEQLEAACEAIRACAERRSPVKVWSAGCSTGEEPYSLAILCREMGVPAQLLATDVDHARLEVAQKGRYSPWALRHVPEGTRRRWFTQGAHDYDVLPEIRRSVTFREHNLCGDPMPVPPTGGAWDVILCRNVFIYLGHERSSRVLAMMARVLDREGWVFLGPSDALHGTRAPLSGVRVGACVAYRHHDAAGDEATRFPPAAETAREVPSTRPVYLELERQAWRRLSEPPPSSAQAVPPGWLRWMNEGNHRLRSHDFRGALEAYEKAREIDPLPAEPHFMMAIVHVKLGDDEDARELLRRALFLEPGHYPAGLLLAGVLGRLGEPRAADRELRHLLTYLDESNDGVRFRSNVAGIASATVDRGEAVAMCRRRLAAAAPGAGRGMRDV